MGLDSSGPIESGHSTKYDSHPDGRKLTREHQVDYLHIRSGSASDCVLLGEEMPGLGPVRLNWDHWVLDRKDVSSPESPGNAGSHFLGNWLARLCFWLPDTLFLSLLRPALCS